ncbi:hypothetical protein L1987_82947 [Smallanthus sonchifolius]|uniref:Uncharacterized protein n=1 Tax=Smallanthus sonchifolius TaxID=185202 RepID=A0ACB8YBG0_9ASTR|nr:hypothetical protein L1987_82947 [Smallanthus sonchifolius]
MNQINITVNRKKRSRRGHSRLQRSSSDVVEVDDDEPCSEMPPPVPVKSVENRNVEEQFRQDLLDLHLSKDMIGDGSSWKNQIEEHDLISAVNEFHVLSSKDLGKLIRDAENGIIKWTKQNGSSFEINVECLARRLGMHIMGNLVLPDEQHFRYLLCCLRLLHTLYDIASHHSKLEQVSEFNFKFIFFLYLSSFSVA